MRLTVISRHRAAYYAPDGPYAVVSITTPEDAPADLLPSPLCAGVLRLAFEDVREAVPGYRCFTEEDAALIWAFVAEHRQVETLVIHCDQGQSRSPGVAAAIDKAVNGDDSAWWKGYRFNYFVRETLLRVAPYRPH